MELLQILALVFLVAGFGTVYAARFIVNRYKLDLSTKCDFEQEMNEDELKNYKLNKAVVNVKMLGMLIALPGLVLLLVSFR
jgi:hypothetical protein